MQNIIFMLSFADDHLHVRWTRRHETTDWNPGSTAELSLMSRFQIIPRQFLKILIKSKPQSVVHVDEPTLKPCAGLCSERVWHCQWLLYTKPTNNKYMNLFFSLKLFSL
jgi:hypothetical protein